MADKKQMQNHTLLTIDNLWVTINALHVKRSLEERLKKLRKLNKRYFERYIQKKTLSRGWNCMSVEDREIHRGAAFMR